MSARLALSLGGVVAAVLVLIGLYWEGRAKGAAIERQKTEAALERAIGAEAEANLARQSAARVDLVVRQQAATGELARSLGQEAAKAKDAHDLLPNDRVGRLRDADNQLCRVAPKLDGCVHKGDNP